MIKVIVNGKEFSFPEGKWSLADLLESVGYEVPLPCAGLGNCGKCQIKVRGNVEVLESDKKLIPSHKLEDGYVLACRTRSLSGDIYVELPPQKERKEIKLEEVKVEHVDIGMDLGTTTIVLNFMPEEQGRVFYSSSFLNPQASYGADVISRTTYISNDKEKLKRLQSKVLDKLKVEIGKVKDAINFKDVHFIAVAGNSIMEHIFAGLDPVPLTRFPFKMAFKEGLTMSGDKLGLEVVNQFYLFPLIGPYVGGDTVALLVDLDPYKKTKSRVIVDIGTNGEIVVQKGEKLVATAAAAGPAFEGGNITFGMRAVDGAIERVWLEDDRLKIKTIGNIPPEGICGSGLVDLITLLYQEGVVSKDGMIKDPFEIDSSLFNRVKERDGKRIFVVYKDAKREIYLTQKDIREFQLAKGAIRAGIEILMEKLSLSWEEIEEIIIAGAFGSYLTKEGLVGVGMFPKFVEGKIVFVGDAVIRGVNKLLKTGDFTKAEDIASQVEYVELSLEQNFQDVFLSSLSLGGG